MSILALDPDTKKMGWALFSDFGELKESGVLIFRREKKVFCSENLVWINIDLEKFIYEHPASTIIIEAPNSRHFGTLLKIGKVLGILEVIIESMWTEVKIEYMPVPTWKKIVTGSGRATKQEVREYLEMEGVKFNTKLMDESDAIGIGIAYLRRENENE